MRCIAPVVVFVAFGVLLLDHPIAFKDFYATCVAGAALGITLYILLDIRS